MNSEVCSGLVHHLEIAYTVMAATKPKCLIIFVLWWVDETHCFAAVVALAIAVSTSPADCFLGPSSGQEKPLCN